MVEGGRGGGDGEVRGGGGCGCEWVVEVDIFSDLGWDPRGEEVVT